MFVDFEVDDPSAEITVTLNNKQMDPVSVNGIHRYRSPITSESGLSEGTRLVQIEAADFVQNIAFETVPITLDFSPPQLVNPSINYEPGPDNVLSTVSAGAVDTNIVITFTTNEFAYGPVNNEENDGESNDTGTDYPGTLRRTGRHDLQVEFTPDTNVITPPNILFIDGT